MTVSRPIRPSNARFVCHSLARKSFFACIVQSHRRQTLDARSFYSCAIAINHVLKVIYQKLHLCTRRTFVHLIGRWCCRADPVAMATCELRLERACAQGHSTRRPSTTDNEGGQRAKLAMHAETSALGQ